jgi:hypothetical protein
MGTVDETANFLTREALEEQIRLVEDAEIQPDYWPTPEWLAIQRHYNPGFDFPSEALLDTQQCYVDKIVELSRQREYVKSHSRESTTS